MMNHNDILDPELLIVRAREGDGAALGQLLGLFHNYLHLLAQLRIGRQLQGRFDASDVVQETFLCAHRDFETFQGATEKELAHWLRSVLSARLTDLFRRHLGARIRDVRLEAELAHELDRSSRALHLGFFAQSSSPSEKVVRREQAVLLADCIRQLPKHYAEVIVLHHLEGLSFPEVAEHMKRSLDSVKKLWVRGLARLRTSMGEDT